MTTSIPDSRLPAHEARRLWSVACRAPDPVSAFRELEALRCAGHPLQYLEGTAAFGPIELMVDERVLIPRPETEQLWELAIRLVKGPAIVVDLGTGSGALALALAHAFPAARVIGVDLSSSALDVARFNGEHLGLDVEWRHGDLWAALDPGLAGTVDLVVSNPPYIAEGDWESLPPDVRQEPRGALIAGPTGFEVLERIAAGADRWLAPGGWVACEIGETQGSASRELFAARLTDVRIAVDLAGRERFVVGRRP
jgi:release factor glutamine methyltransferase